MDIFGGAWVHKVVLESCITVRPDMFGKGHHLLLNYVSIILPFSICIVGLATTTGLVRFFLDTIDPVDLVVWAVPFLLLVGDGVLTSSNSSTEEKIIKEIKLFRFVS